MVLRVCACGCVSVHVALCAVRMCLYQVCIVFNECVWHFRISITGFRGMWQRHIYKYTAMRLDFLSLGSALLYLYIYSAHLSWKYKWFL